MNLYSTNPKSITSFFRLPLVWGTAAALLVLAITASTLIFYNGNYYYCGTAECFNFFLSEFKLPIGILALGIPLGALYAAQHRSVQTAEQIQKAEVQITNSIRQIELSHSQNNFTNYFKHFDEFKLYIKEFQYNLIIPNIRSSYSKLFPESRSGNYKVPSKVDSQLSGDFYKIFVHLKALKDERDIEKKQHAYREVHNYISKLLSILNLKHDDDNLPNGVISENANLRNLIFVPLTDLIKFIQAVYNYSDTTETPRIIEYLAALNIDRDTYDIYLNTELTYRFGDFEE